MENDENILRLKYNITCENCDHAFIRFETLKFQPFTKFERQFYPGGNEQKFSSILCTMNTSHKFEGSKVEIKCPNCGYIPTWNIKTTERRMAYRIQSIFAIPITMILGYFFVRVSIVSHAIWLAIGLFLLLLILYLGLNVVGLDIGEKLAPYFVKANKAFPKVEKILYPIVEKVN